MKSSAVGVLFFAALFLLSTSSAAAVITGSDFPYGRFQLRTPPQENPFPGLGSYYATLSDGISTVMWNPASLGKLKTAQLNFAAFNELAPGAFSYKYQTKDTQQSLGSSNNMSIGLYVTPDINVTNAATREHTAHASYRTQSSGLNFRQGLRINDWLSLGAIERGDSGAAIDLSGSSTIVSKFTTNFLNSSISFGSRLTVTVDNSGFASILVTPEAGLTYTSNLTEKIWRGFTQQNSTVPFTSLLEARNDVSLSAPYTLAGAANYGKFCFGAAFTPITASANINNNVKIIINEGTKDMFLYLPNIDPNDEQSFLNWVDNPNQYATELGYRKNTVRVPAGETIAEARYKGFYQASTARLDLGGTYDFGEAMTVGLALENIGGAALDFRGAGRVAYANSRIGTLEAPSLDLTQTFNWSPFKETFVPISGSENMSLEEQLNGPLPKRTRLGFVLHKPFLIAIDYETNQTPIRYKYKDETTQLTTVGEISNLNFLRAGLESSLFGLPCLLRTNFIFMLKPTLTNFPADIQSQVNSLFKYKVLLAPVGFDLGTELNLQGTIIGASGGYNATSLLSLAQLDSLNVDLGKISYYNIYGSRGPWRVSYLAAFDAGSTGLAYANRADKSAKNFDLSILRYVQTLTVGYAF
ncbi:hypothetical protein HZB07_01985 [Candidatus Saganbacteria bacterium]|nr:hypothetical protein [Candidatus Saganbacteria bacterium]